MWKFAKENVEKWVKVRRFVGDGVEFLAGQVRHWEDSWTRSVRRRRKNDSRKRRCYGSFAAGRAECFVRLVLAGQHDAHGRSLLDNAERLTDRLAMYWEKEVGWLSASLGAAGVDETTLTGVGFNSQQVRHATVVKPPAGESPDDYAERIAIYNEPDAFAVATGMLEDAAAINPAVPIETTDAARRNAIELLDHAMEQWYEHNQ